MIRSPLPLAVVLVAALVIPTLLIAQETELKVSKIALFSSGVGYFEREAEIDGSAAAELKFRTAQINDILKSLVVQDFGKGTISAVGYASHDPVDKALKSFAVDITGRPTMAALLDQLRGEPVEITGSRAVNGVIVGVEKLKIAMEQQTVEIDVLNVLTESGLQQLRLSEIGGVKLKNEKINGELRKALETLAASHDADKKAVTIQFAGDGKRRVRASYLLEAPIWKTSYRLVLSPDKKPFLQGWATVENATEEDWRDVRLSLVSGRPISFSMDLYTPLYVARPREELELYASLRPPTLEAGIAVADRPARPAPAPAAEAPLTSARPAARARSARAPMRRVHAVGGMGGYGGYGMGGMGGMGVPAEVEPEMDLAAQGVESVAEAQSAGELFEYAISAPVSIARQRSAMLPIVNQEIAAEKVSIYNPATHRKHPLNGLIVDNTTGLNLMQGPITVFDENVYAGDAKLPDIKPAEKRMVAYALDLGVEVIEDQKERPDELLSARIAKGTLILQHKLVDVSEYTIRNKDKKNRDVIIEQDYNSEWKLVEPKEPFERTQNLLRFRTAVPAGETVVQKVQLEAVTDEEIHLTTIDEEFTGIYLKSKVISDAVRQALEKVIRIQSELETLERDLDQREEDLENSVAEQARIRENLKTLQANSDPYQRQLKKFDLVETRIEQLQGQLDELRKQAQKKQEELEAYVLSLDVK
ncbi:MAG: hypothetical protein GX616_08230 [Planctomycetes bacterium]|nr:hypothetical protein [Planctomycetota bacterium]